MKTRDKTKSPFIPVHRNIIFAQMSVEAKVIYMCILEAWYHGELRKLSHFDLHFSLQIPSKVIDRALQELVTYEFASDERECDHLLNIAHLFGPKLLPRGSKAGWIYMISCDDKYKIGRTADPIPRLKQLQYDIRRERKREITVIKVRLVEDMRLTEAELHGQYEHKHISNEWFALDADDVAAILEGWER
jgi:hypothetical protein